MISFGQTYVPSSSDHYFQSNLFYKILKSEECRRTDMYENDDHYRLTG